MKLHVVVVRDRAADVFGTPYFVVSLGAAIRSFGDEINRGGEQNMLARHPEDFDLYVLGCYDDATASFTVGVPRQLSVGKDLVVKKESGNVS